MTRLRLAVVAMLLAASGLMVVVGATRLAVGAGWIVAGVMLAGWTWLVFGVTR